ncbi:peptidogalycan biosysnthesis protein [Yinghuangia sp. ASG 101]|uniref:peptidogalycan biosysnthesis protein n=1 Tax=Yinghuangia sp. ASG 101 TaxID=2896848 RepID=UPI001E442A74|nr:peptidogalycan biosysnthesis protein [Yinghuangia sp. ASG 101]UGQ11511.1 peptidogalycan biosysnthesis protein [Yinghuangia sp. ASG 101]
MTGVSISTTSSVSEIVDIPAPDWRDLIGPTGFYAGREWLRSLELAHGAHGILTASRDGRVLAAAPTWNRGADEGPLFELPRMAGGLPGPWDERFLWLGGHRVTTNAIPCRSDLNVRADVLADLLRAARADATRRGRAGVVWPYLPAAAARELAATCASARVILHSADAVLSVPAGGMPQLAASVAGRDRRGWHREQQAFERSGATVEWHPLDAYVSEQVATLGAANRTKYGADGGRASLRAALAAQRDAGVTAHAVVGVARIGARFAAVAVFYRHGGRLFGRYWGAASDAPPFAYFVLTIYEAVNWAARHGFTHLHLSVTAWEAKVARGAVLHPLAMVVAPALGRDTWFDPSTAHDHNARFAASWRARFASRPAALDPGWRDWE